jgi:two-component system, chemotaxis family, chemotaxis protein CheY
MSQHILIIDDDPAIRETLAEVLEEEGYTVEVANNGAEGLAAIERIRPAMLLLDMRMPVMDGWSLARVLHERAIKLPVVVMTAAQETHQWSQEIAAAAVLAKPFNLNELLEVVGRTFPVNPTQGPGTQAV